jgi:hypothetical protein
VPRPAEVLGGQDGGLDVAPAQWTSLAIAVAMAIAAVTGVLLHPLPHMPAAGLVIAAPVVARRCLPRPARRPQI